MATAFHAVAKNVMLQGLLDWNPGTLGANMKFAAYSEDADGSVVGTPTAGTYSTPASGAMDITANVVLNIGAGNSIRHMRIQKGTAAGPAVYIIYKKDVTTMTFTYAGTITVTSGEISLVDPA